ncbi:MAG TPA: hypothetical protein PKA41_07940 [Verrucomicrobiota bacterium]|nr:hypothetical protein [Verrucomicrobiota bacterium]
MNFKRKYRGVFSLAVLLHTMAILCLLAVLAIPQQAKAIELWQQTQIISATNLPATMPAAWITNCASYLPVTQGQGAAVYWRFNTTAGNSNAVLYLYPSADGTNYATSVPWTLTRPVTAATDVHAVTNFTADQLAGIRSFKISLSWAGDTGTFTNKSLLWGRPHDQ